jgi:hypothetical protein
MEVYKPSPTYHYLHLCQQKSVGQFGPTGGKDFPEESETFCTLDEISFEKSLLVGALKKRRIDETQDKAFLKPRNIG